jgi:hypothetical protein
LKTFENLLIRQEIWMPEEGIFCHLALAVIPLNTEDLFLPVLLFVVKAHRRGTR